MYVFLENVMVRKMTLARIGLWSAIKIGFFLSMAAGFLLGLFFGVLLAVFSSLLALAAHVRQPVMGPGVLIVLPVFFALACGFIGATVSFLGALVYNLASGLAGGLEIEADFRDGKDQPPRGAMPAMPPEQPEENTVLPARTGIFRRASFMAASERPRLIGLRKARRRMM